MTPIEIQSGMPPPASLLQLEGLTRRFFGVPVLRDVSLTLDPGSVLGLVGENGAGKTTLLNLLGGVFPPDAGRMRLSGRPYAPRDPADALRQGVAFIHQEINLFPNLSVAENLFISALPLRRAAGIPLIDRKALRERAAALLAEVGLDVPPDALLERLSPGERQLVEIAKALGVDARIILFDEPTTSLTARETERLFALIGRLRGRGVAMIYISHILGDVLRLCDAVTVLRDGEAVGSGPRGEFTAERMIALMVGRAIDEVYPARAAAPSAEPALDVRGVGQPGVVEDIRFTLHKGEVLGLFGLMGSGRTELARILFGLDPCEAGEVLLHGRALDACPPRERIRRGMAFLTEDRREEGLLPEASVAENIALAALPAFARRGLGLVERARLARAVQGAAGSVRLHCASLDRQPAKSLSGGNQQKAILARWLLAGPSVILLDEPTRGIDVGAKHEIYGLVNDLAARGAGALFISSEIEELIGMCDRILVMRRGRMAEAYARGGLDRERILRSALGE